MKRYLAFALVILIRMFGCATPAQVGENDRKIRYGAFHGAFRSGSIAFSRSHVLTLPLQMSAHAFGGVCFAAFGVPKRMGPRAFKSEKPNRSFEQC